MYYSIYPQYDATIYEKHPERNTGVDQILELRKIAINSEDPEGGYWSSTFNSRILIKFNLSEISASIVSGDIPTNAKYYLSMFLATGNDLPVDYTIYAYPVSESWTNGNGNYGDFPETKQGVSWKYRTGYPELLKWSSGSNVDKSFQSTEGGGSWYTGSGYEASQSFNYIQPDLRMNITDIVNKWLTNNITNNGLIIKRSNTDESGSSVFGSLKYFSKDTHTIYLPKLEILWDDSNLSGTGSFTQVGENYIFSPTNIKPFYLESSRAKIRFRARDKYPVRTYATSSNYIQNKRLPTSSFYSVRDYVTGETIIPFDSNYTKVSCDNQGNYINLRMNAFLPERYYELVFKVETEGGNVVEYLDNKYLFKVTR